MYDTLREYLPTGMLWNMKLPSRSAVTPILVVSRTTLAPMRGSFVLLSDTCPFNDPICAFDKDGIARTKNSIAEAAIPVFRIVHLSMKILLKKMFQTSLNFSLKKKEQGSRTPRERRQIVPPDESAAAMHRNERDPTERSYAGSLHKDKSSSALRRLRRIIQS